MEILDCKSEKFVRLQCKFSWQEKQSNKQWRWCCCCCYEVPVCPVTRVIYWIDSYLHHLSMDCSMFVWSVNLSEYRRISIANSIRDFCRAHSNFKNAKISNETSIKWILAQRNGFFRYFISISHALTRHCVTLLNYKYLHAASFFCLKLQTLYTRESVRNPNQMSLMHIKQLLHPNWMLTVIHRQQMVR